MQARWLLIALAVGGAAVAGTAAAQQPIVVRVQASSGWLGFAYENEPGADGPRIVVDTVIPESPAARAGMQKADTIVRVNGLRATPQLLASLSSSLEPGDAVELAVRRGGSARTLTVTAAERPEGFRMMGGNVVAFEPDSIRRVLRGVFDSVRVHLDTLTLPRVFIQRDGDGGAVIIGRGNMLDTVRIFGDSLRSARLFSDSMRTVFDSMRVRMVRPDVHIEILGDSMVMRDSLGVHRLLPRGDGFWFGSGDFHFDAPMGGITRIGMRAVAGMVLEELSPELGRYFGTDSGLLVLEVAEESPAARAGMREGDVIQRVNGRAVDRVAELRRAVIAAGDDDVTLAVLRERRTLELVVKRAP